MRVGLWWPLVKNTSITSFNYRVTGLAAEAAFFALLSLPPLVLGLIGTLGYFRPALGPAAVADVRSWVIEKSGLLFTGDTVNGVVVPLVDDVLAGGRADLVSLGFLLSLWSGSRALFVYVDVISVAYGLGEVRGIVRTRIMSFGLYIAALGVGLVVIPLFVAGPTIVTSLIPHYDGLVEVLYWPLAVLVSIGLLTTLYHVSVPVRTRWRRELPGAVLALIIWALCGFVLRIVLGASFTPVSIYGSLAAPIAVLLWLYVTALGVLIGATLNAEADKLWPEGTTARARAAHDA
ncbi:YihY/virulence factor BrkB family protein [Bailinhaonella thermotolerans]|uniref:YihY/virulence factor BrkB family protein n=1 Tax=Bailinhaonella thermotolerans TaxID=1070861 RepID=A0A3A4B8U1_9ACTN|nr:YihY/virulence factor BrkB family protein [Bailinhaonella thermotolerans]